MFRRGVARSSGSVVALALLVLFAESVAAGDDWVYVASSNRYAVIDPSVGEIMREGVLETSDFRTEGEQTPTIVPTPGGRYVFFHFSDFDRAVVVDAETHQVTWSVELPFGTERLQFSSMGNQIFALQRDGRRIQLPHRRGEITGTGGIAPLLGPESIAFNRRATRIYGNNGNDLVFVLENGGNVIRTIDLRGGPYEWQVSANFRYLLGSSSSGLTLVDEQRGRAVGYIEDGFTPTATLFDASSREIYALSADGREIIVADTRRFTEQERIVMQTPLSGIWQSSDGRLHGISRPDSDRVSPALVVDLLDVQETVSFPPSILATDSAIAAALVTLRPGEGFACF